MILSFLPSRMRTLRIEAKLTQEEIAKHLNIERQTYCNYENEFRTPPLDVIVGLADFYCISIDYLLREDAARTGLRSSHFPEVTDTEKTFLAAFRALPNQSQEEVLDFIHFKSYTASTKKIIK